MKNRAHDTYIWIIEHTEGLGLLTKLNLIQLFYLLGGLSGHTSEELAKEPKILDIIDSDFPEFNEILELPDSEKFVVPFLDWQTEKWEYDPEQRVAVEK